MKRFRPPATETSLPMSTEPPRTPSRTHGDRSRECDLIFWSQPDASVACDRNRHPPPGRGRVSRNLRYCRRRRRPGCSGRNGRWPAGPLLDRPHPGGPTPPGSGRRSIQHRPGSGAAARRGIRVTPSIGPQRDEVPGTHGRICSRTARIQSETAITGPGRPSSRRVMNGTWGSASGFIRLCRSHASPSRRSSFHEVTDHVRLHPHSAKRACVEPGSPTGQPRRWRAPGMRAGSAPAAAM